MRSRILGCLILVAGLLSTLGCARKLDEDFCATLSAKGRQCRTPSLPPLWKRCVRT